MTKDFMALVDMGICDKGKTLKMYCTSQLVFFPPHPQYVVKSTVKGFKLYWKGEIGIDKLKDYCYLRDVDELYKYYGQFLEEE